MFSDYEKKFEKENISKDEFNFEEDSELEDDKKHTFNPTLNAIKTFFFILSFLMIVGMAVHVARILYLSILKKICIYMFFYYF